MKLEEYCKALGITLSEAELKKFDIYMNLVIEWNEKINLTSITDKDEFVIKHFYDSLTLIAKINIKNGASVIDVGTGAGFPGIPIKIVRPDIKLTLLDSLNKRLVFLNDQVLKELSLSANVVHGRAEECSKNPNFREKFDVATSRAVANMSSLCEYCLPFVKVGGVFAPMKGRDVDEEVTAAKNAISTLGGQIDRIEKLTLPDNSERGIVVIDKVRNTPQKYPRRGVKISKNPL